MAEGSVAEAEAKINAALDAGMTCIDTAAIYGVDEVAFGHCEVMLGEVMAKDKSLRDRMVLATKGGIVLGEPYDSTPAYILQTVDESLKRLQTDVIDLWYVHRPDLLTPWDDVAEGLNKIVESGKVKEVAISNFTTHQIDALQSKMDIALTAHQVELSPSRQDALYNGEMDQMQCFDMTCFAWSPLGGGDMMRQDPAEASMQGRVAKALDAVAEQNGVDRASAALAFVMISNPRTIPIIGTQNVARIAAANDALKVEMSRNQYYEIVQAWRGSPLP